MKTICVGRYQKQEIPRHMRIVYVWLVVLIMGAYVALAMGIEAVWRVICG
jgi:hypothetical protein